MMEDEKREPPGDSQLANGTVCSSADKNYLAAKNVKIRDACRCRNIEDLRELAISKGGFVSDKTRQQAWPLLLGYEVNAVPLVPETKLEPVLEQDETETDTPPSEGEKANAVFSWRDLPVHRDEVQVGLDVERSFVYYPNHPSQSTLEADKLALSELIIEVLRRHPYLSYFQGYHDICQVFLLALPPSSRYEAVSRLSLFRIRDYMLPELAPCINQLRLIPELLAIADPPLAKHLGIPPRINPLLALLTRYRPTAQSHLSFLAALARSSPRSDVPDSTVHLAAMQGTLTMYAHDIQSYSAIARLFDALLSHDPVFSLYVFVEMVRSRREDLLEADADDPDLLHFTLQKLPQHHDLDIDAVVAAAKELYDSRPPERLIGWRDISKFSVLKSHRAPKSSTESLAYGSHSPEAVEKVALDKLHSAPENNEETASALFHAHVQEMKEDEERKKRIKSLRRHRGAVGKAAGVAAVGVFVMAVLNISGKNGGAGAKAGGWVWSMLGGR